MPVVMISTLTTEGADTTLRALELGERGDGTSALVAEVMVDLEQQRLVALDDEGAVGHRIRLRPVRAGEGARLVSVVSGALQVVAVAGISGTRLSRTASKASGAMRPRSTP